MATVVSKRIRGTPLSAEQIRRLEALARMPDSEIDYSDAPALGEQAWKHAERGKFYRPVKHAVSLRLDVDVIAWLKKDGEGYQTRANQMLRERMLEDLKRKSKKRTASAA